MPGNSKIFYNGNIITMEPPFYQAESILVENKKVRAVGSFNMLVKEKDAQTQMIDLQNKTLIPAFVNPFSRLFAYAESLRYVSLKEATSFEDIIRMMQERKERIASPDGQWLIGYGYDHKRLFEKTHPDKRMLDKISALTPVLLCHESKSRGVVNSAGLACLGITKDTPVPRNGIIGHYVDTGEPNGYLEDSAFTDFASKVPEPDGEVALDFLKQAQKAFLQCGITAVREIRMTEKKWELLMEADRKDRLLLDISCCRERSAAFLEKEESVHIYDSESGRLKWGGYYFAVDGSLRRRAAWLTHPYRNAGDGYCGYPAVKEEQMIEILRKAVFEKAPLVVACNGDAALEHFLGAVRKLSAESGERLPENGVTISIVAALQEQLVEINERGMIPSFAVSGIYYWGDTDLENIGAERAMGLYPLNSAALLEIPFSLHQDFTRLPDVLEAVRCAVSRVSRGGVVMGETEKISPLQALKAATLYAARACDEEEKRGSLKAGKAADLVILSGNPLTASAEELREIHVVKTYKDGAEVYSKG